MSSIIQFQTPSERRSEFIFRVKKHRITTSEDKQLDFPTIVLYHRETGVPVGYPGFERWLYEMNRVESMHSETLYKKAVYLCSFLNYILWHTTCDSISDVSLNTLRNFFVDFKENADGGPRDPQEWTRGIDFVTKFMNNYVNYNQDVMDFKMTSEDLITPVEIRIKDGRRTVVYDRGNKLFVKPPKKMKKKYRLLLHNHLDLLLYEAKKWDPMLVPAIMEQAYAGLREGEVVNTSVSNIRRVYGKFARIREIVIDLEQPAEFARKWEGKSEFGSIKVPREQRVYPTFIESITKALDEHEQFLHTLGYELNEGDPLYYNEWGKPMSVSTYTGRLKKLFYEHFLPDLRRLCEAQGVWAENAPYIEAYEKEYPGAHMLRHWFTMYLLQYTTLKSEEISHWRGDSDIKSMKDYIHVNSDFIKVYREAVFTMQGELLEEIL